MPPYSPDKDSLRATLPAELGHLPENAIVPVKLLEIIDWSKSRRTPEVTASAHDALDLVDTQERRAGFLPVLQDSTTTSHKVENVSDAPTTLSSTERQSSKLQTFKSKVFCSAADLIASVKERQERRQCPDAEKAQSNEGRMVSNECTSCFDEISKKDSITLSCNHAYCKTCLATMVMTSVQHESAYPPKCCLAEVPLQTILVSLDSTQRVLFKNKAAEYAIPINNRWCVNTIPRGIY